MKKITKTLAKKYSLIKWSYAKRIGCTLGQLRKYLRKEYPLIYGLTGQCGYCEYYLQRYKYISHACTGPCPLGDKKLNTCTALYQKWISAKKVETRKKYAEKIYQDIKRSKL